ncbi:potassium channel family protein [Paenibacillus sp. JSM ZJ436]|uniref:potassium channel family protein n=1 Tax=Paenibacillus sp. JSM ZJ436 TaxID=3376190 RepID=UPI0037BBD385
MLSFILTLKRTLKGFRYALKLKNFQILGSLVIIMLASGTLFYVKQEGLEPLDALYFCVATLSTVGHPSFEPVTTLGKWFTIFFIISGTGLFIGMAGYLAYALIKNPRFEK